MDFKFISDNFNKFNFLIINKDYSINTDNFTNCEYVPGQNNLDNCLTFINETSNLEIAISENKNTKIVIKGLR